MLDAFKIQPFDLQPVFASWKDAPRFLGKPKRDPPVDEWLAQIKAGCVERKVPKEYWHKVGQHYLGDKAQARLEGVKLVMQNMHGGRFRWNWKSFKTAMCNMGWDIDPSKTEAIEVKSKPSGFWWIVGRRGDSASQEPKTATPPKPRPQKSRSSTDVPTRKSKPVPKRANTTGSIQSISSLTSSVFSSHSCIPKTPRDATPPLTPVGTPGEITTTVAHAPLWLINVCQSLAPITHEHPKAMTALSAVLITLGSLPALPVVSAGVGGTFLASSTAHALGSVAVGLGTWLRAQSEGQMEIAPMRS
ncbi:uncharacterized protein LAESUDRAFT_702632 [Laetiporus sulphureus 93-53]|uniref:Uncharacterized protein n=1 Tax=Laetiporus sulphureus 93-53 TaxID=1314785 RepID=A0A165DK88_9APHY|nr:uncharacterized protein LAESUDRAFT_702632 [Laetiporus sulphureus 93-53]KZT05065.1 hypothetical protein LAESUDRAFT_702632 [Laetiporus sulphureus 93-53]